MIKVIILSIFIIYMTYLKWIIFKKAGKKSIYSLIPIYSDLILFEITQLSKAYIIPYIVCIGLFYVPLFTIITQLLGSLFIFILTVNFCIYLAESFNQSKPFGIGIFLLSPIFLSIIAFNNNITYKYNKKLEIKDYKLNKHSSHINRNTYTKKIIKLIENKEEDTNYNFY